MMKFRLTANRAVFVVGAVLATLYGGAKHATGRISYPRTDPETWYLMDNGSYVTNNAVHVAYLRNTILPDSANFFIEGLELSYTNEGDWAEHSFLAYSNTLGSAVSPFDMAWPAATNYNWIAYTDWVPPPTTHTNGVAYAAWQRPLDGATNKVVTYKTGIYIDARRIAPNVVRLPYDAEVEYLESTGTQWIDTGYVYNADSKFVCDAMLMSVPSDTFATMFGAVQDYNGVFVALNNTVPMQARFGANTVGNIVSSLSVWNAVGVRHKYELSARRFVIDNDVFTRNDFTPYTLTRSIWLCSCNDSVSGNLNKRPCSLRVYSFDIYNGNALVRDFIPVRVGTTGALYDKRGVGGMNGNGTARNDGLYFNRGTGAFIIGPDK